MRRTIGIIIALVPFVCAWIGPTANHSNYFGYGEMLSRIDEYFLLHIVPIGCLILGGGISLLNFFLSFIRPLAYKLWHGSMDGYHFVSGIPLFGSLLLTFSSIIPTALNKFAFDIFCSAD